MKFSFIFGVLILFVSSSSVLGWSEDDLEFECGFESCPKGHPDRYNSSKPKFHFKGIDYH
jgi:hypothetical protein